MPRSKATSSSRDLPAPAAGAGLLVVNGWRIGFDAELLLQMEKLISVMVQERRQYPDRPHSPSRRRFLPCFGS